MDLTRLEELHEEGRWEEVSKLFDQMLWDEIYEGHQVGDDVSHLVHYTTLDALISMLGVNTVDGETYVLPAAERDDTEEAKDRARQRGYLRLYDTFSANDPNEGTFFVTSADPTGSFQKKYGAVWRLFEQRSKSPAYQTSLKQVGKAEDADELVSWQTYGGDGKGCALVFPAKRLEGLHKLYTVRYGAEAAMDCLNRIDAALDAYTSLGVPGAPDFAGSRGPYHLPSSIANVLSPLVYLYKSEHYGSEREARVVVPFSDLEKGALLQKGSWRHFAQLPELKIGKLLESPAKIVFGPSVVGLANLKFVLSALLRQRGIGPTLTQSGISYRS